MISVESSTCSWQLEPACGSLVYYRSKIVLAQVYTLHSDENSHTAEIDMYTVSSTGTKDSN